MSAAKQDNKRIIRFQPERVHELIDDQDVLDKESLMYPAYVAAFIALEDIFSSNMRWNSSFTHDELAYHLERPITQRARNADDAELSKLYGFSNNMIAFYGKRGNGKTSAMLSFTKALSDYRPNKNEELIEHLGENRRFYVIPPIDPSSLRQDESPVELILAKLVDDLIDLWESGRYVSEVSEKEYFDVLQSCGKTVESIRRKSGRERNDFFEEFIQTVDVFEVKRNIFRAVRLLFKLNGWGRKDAYIIIQLDDADMRRENIFDMVEQVRRFLTLPQVIVTVAADFTQLRNMIAQEYEKSLGKSVERSEDKSEDRNGSRFNFDYIASKYIDKLIPASHSIHIPTLKNAYEEGCEIQVKCPRTEPEKDRYGNPAENEEDAISHEEFLFDLIYKKTGLIFIRHSTVMHDLVPSTLRGYFNLCRFLYTMETPKTVKQLEEYLTPEGDLTREYCQQRLNSNAIKLRNLTLFENYFKQDWVISRVNFAADRTISNLDDLTRPKLVPGMISILAEKFKWSKPKEEYINCNCLSLLEALSWAQKNYAQSDSYDFRLLCALYIYYSIQLKKSALIDESDSIRNDWLIEGSEPIPIDITYSFNFKRLSQLMGISPKKTALADLGSKTETSYVFGVKRIIECLIDDLFATPDIGGKLIHMREVIRLQDQLVSTVCNYDMLHQLFDNVTIPDSKSGKLYFSYSSIECLKELLEVLKKKNASIAKQEEFDLGNLLPRFFTHKYSTESHNPTNNPGIKAIRETLVSLERLGAIIESAKSFTKDQALKFWSDSVMPRINSIKSGLAAPGGPEADIWGKNLDELSKGKDNIKSVDDSDKLSKVLESLVNSCKNLEDALEQYMHDAEHEA